MIPTFNSSKFLRKTLESVLVQDPGPQFMHIEVVDDCSDDDTATVVEAVGRGRIGFFRQSSRLGQVANLNAAVGRARGEIVHLLHGDDFVLPGFYEALGTAFESDAEVGAAFCRWMIVDGEGAVLSVADAEQERAGRLSNSLERLASEQRIVTPSIAVRRRVWQQLGGFDPRLRCAEDWEMWVRIAARYPIWYEPALLAAYRRHEHSTTSQNIRNAGELRYSKMAIDIFAPLLPPSRRRAIVRAARRTNARKAILNGTQFLRAGDWAAAWSNFAMAAKLDPSPRTLLLAARGAAGTLRR